MLITQFHQAFETTAEAWKASVESMLLRTHPGAQRNCGSHRTVSVSLIAMRGSLAASAVVIALLFFLVPRAGALAAQSNVDTGSQPAAMNSPSAFNASLQPALDQVETAINQIQIDRWKLPREWKSQLHNDADSIQQDISHQLPALFQQVQASPRALDAQMRVMQNVNALYDVLVRLTMAADITEKKNDAAMLANALHQLETARKATSDELLRAISLQNQQILHLQSQLAEDRATEHPSASRAKTIIVDNGATHHTIRHRSVHREKPSSPASRTAKPAQGETHAPQVKAPNQR